MKWINAVLAACGIGAAAVAVQPADAANVKITPLGSHDGEFCPLDRALVLEDPDGTRLLYDPGRTVTGSGDARLGKIDAVLVSHVHGDHVGDRHLPSVNAGTCAQPDFSVQATPNSNSVNIILAKKAKLILGGEMPAFFANKVAASWDPASVWKQLPDPMRLGLGTATRETMLEVSLAADGTLVKLAILKSSGVAELDAEAIRAFQISSPFGPSPTGLGASPFKFSFFFEVGGSSTIGVAP